MGLSVMCITPLYVRVWEGHITRVLSPETGPVRKEPVRALHARFVAEVSRRASPGQCGLSLRFIGRFHWLLALLKSVSFEDS